MKKLLSMALLFIAAGTQAQQPETIELPLSLYNQTKWQAVETTVTLSGEEEEQLAYELKGWPTSNGMSRRGTVYYVPSALDDRIILVLKDVVSGYAKLPALIDNKTDKTLVIQLQGRVTLNCQGTAIRSLGDVSFIGELGDDDDAPPVSTLIMQGGIRGHAAVETAGDVYLQGIRLEMGGNAAPYGFLCTYTEGKEERVLEMNHTTGEVKAKNATAAGFQKIVGSQGSSVKGLEPNWSLEEEYGGAADEDDEAEPDEDEGDGAEAAVPLVGGDLFIPFSVMGQNRFPLEPAEEIRLSKDVTVKGIALSVNLQGGTIYWIPNDDSFLFSDVDLSSDVSTPVIGNTSGQNLVIRFRGDNRIASKGDAFVSQGHVMLYGTQALTDEGGSTLKMSTDGRCFLLKDSHNFYAENLSMHLTGDCGVKSEGPGDTRFELRSCELLVKGESSSIEGFFDVVGVRCGPLYGYLQAPKTMLYDQKARTFMLGNDPFTELEFANGNAYLEINTPAGPWKASTAEKVLRR